MLKKPQQKRIGDIMIYRVDTTTKINDNWMLSIYTYLSEYMEGVTYDANTSTITFFDRFSYYMSGQTLYLKYGSRVIEIGGRWDKSGGYITYTFILSDNHMYLNCTPNSGDGRMSFTYLKDAQDNYYASASEYRGGLPLVYDYTYYNTSIESSIEGYTLPKAINCTSPTGKILYSNKAIINHSNSITTVIPNVYSCSNVTRFSTITIAGVNYFAIDTNNLVLMGE